MNRTNEKRIDALFQELVPAEGPAATVAGEIVRAMCRIGHRWNNDGDRIGIEWGKETCNAAARYLMERAGEKTAEAVKQAWEYYGANYGAKVDGIVCAVLDYLDAHPELRETENSEDYWDLEKPEDYEDEDDEW